MGRSLTISLTALSAPVKQAAIVMISSRASALPLVPGAPASPSGDGSNRMIAARAIGAAASGSGGGVLRAERRALELPRPVPVRLGVEGLEDLRPARLAEMTQAFARRSVERDLAAGDEDEQPVAQVQIGDAVRNDDDGTAVVGELSHHLHD